jgi:dihydroorotate dehydrogenase (NAD+) catalytic subunit
MAIGLSGRVTPLGKRMLPEVNLSVEISGLKFKNPVLTASGTFGYGLEFLDFFDISELGGFCTKGLSLHPMKGNAPGRIAETPSGMLNAIGLENVGVECFIQEKLPLLADSDSLIIANIFGKTIDEFVALTEILNPQQKVAAYELNISCPNIKEGGVQFGHDPEMTHRVVEAVSEVSTKPVWVKLSPNVTDITVFAKACEQAGADAISLVNTFVGMVVDVHKRRPMLSNTTGGLSGPAIRPLAVRLVHQTVQAVDIPVIGIGGISTVRDALEFLIVGASAVQIGTANFVDPSAAVKIVGDLREHCAKEGVSDINEIIGSFQPIEEGGFVYY